MKTITFERAWDVVVTIAVEHAQDINKLHPEVEHLIDLTLLPTGWTIQNVLEEEERTRQERTYRKFQCKAAEYRARFGISGEQKQ